jgi:DNA-binding PadR family transcriptional regulator
MSLKHAILGFLSYGPQTGYNLKNLFDLSVRHFWPADQSQIYRTLSDLADEGFATVELVEQTDRPNKKVYHITETGRAELQRWLLDPIPPLEPRSAPLIQVFFGGLLDDEEMLAKFERLQDQCRAILAAYDQVPEQIEPFFEVAKDQREIFYWLLTLEAGKRTMQAHLEWAESVIERLKKANYTNNLSE